MLAFSIIPILIFGVFFLVLGGISAFLGYTAYKKHKRVKLLTGTNMCTIAALQPGVAKTTGLVVALDEVIRSPMTRRDCVFYDFRVEEQRTRTVTERIGNSNRTRTETYWATIVHDRDSIRFAIEDDTGSAEVDLDGAEVSMQSAAHTNTGMWENVPADLERMLRKRYNTSTKGLLFNRTLRYTEVVIEEGDSMIVLGEVRERTREKRRVLGKGKETPLLISDKSDKALVSQYQWSRNLYAIGACVPIIFLIPIAVIAFVFLGVGVAATQVQQQQQTVLNNPPQNNPPRNNPPIKLPENKLPDLPKEPEEPPPPAGADFVAVAIHESRSKNVFKRIDSVRRLEKLPGNEKDLKEFEDARANEARRKEVAVLLIEVIKGGDQASRHSAITALKLWITSDVVPDVIELMEKEKFTTKHALIEVLGVSKDVRAVGPLIGQLKGLERRHAGPALEAIGPAATAGLVEALKDPKSNREEVCNILGKVGTADALPELKKIAEENNAKGVKTRRLHQAAQSAQKQIEARAKM